MRWRRVNVSWRDVCWVDAAAALACLGLVLSVVWLLAAVPHQAMDPGTKIVAFSSSCLKARVFSTV